MPKTLFLELETSNFAYSHVFLSPLKWRGQILPNLTFWTPKWLFQDAGTIIPKSLFLELETSNFGSSHVFWSLLKWWGQILPNLMFRIQKRHILGTIPGKIHVPLCQNLCFLSYRLQIWATAMFFRAGKNGRVRFYPNWCFEFKNGIFQVQSQVKSRYHYAQKMVSWVRDV